MFYLVLSMLTQLVRILCLVKSDVFIRLLAMACRWQLFTSGYIVFRLPERQNMSVGNYILDKFIIWLAIHYKDSCLSPPVIYTTANKSRLCYLSLKCQLKTVSNVAVIILYKDKSLRKIHLEFSGGKKVVTISQLTTRWLQTTDLSRPPFSSTIPLPLIFKHCVLLVCPTLPSHWSYWGYTDFLWADFWIITCSCSYFGLCSVQNLCIDATHLYVQTSTCWCVNH